MIIKTTRILNSQSALKALLAHLGNTQQNEEVNILRGNKTELQYALKDAQRKGSKIRL